MIFVDLDGVLCDFVGAACKAHGKCVDDVTQWDFYKPWGISKSKFWAPMGGRAWWEKIEAYPWAGDVVSLIAATGLPFTICSTPCVSPGCLSGKVAWLYKHLGHGCRNYVLTPKKELLAAPGRLLIDDCDDNCQKWDAAGGESILFPQPWNNNRKIAVARLPYLREGLECFRESLAGTAA